MGTSSGTCSQFAEDFSGLSANTWDGTSGNWYVQGELLRLNQIAAGDLAFYQTDFWPSDFFTIDVDIQLDAFPAGAAVGIIPFTSGDAYIGVGDRTTDGIGVIYFPDGRAQLFGYDWEIGDWFLSSPYQVSGTPTSIGVAYDESEITLRINNQNTSLKLTGDFSIAPYLLDTLWLIAQGEGAQVGFDNVCADLLVPAPVDNPPTVVITSPSDGASVSGTVTVQASASDDDGVAKVEFSVDGVKQRTDTSSPYTYAWDTTTVANGSHTIQARAFDTADQTAQSEVDVTVSNGSVQPFGTGSVFYFPFCQSDAANFTGFAVSNYSSNLARLQFTPFTSSGAQAYSTSQYSLEPQHQLGKLCNELFGQPAGSQQSLWIEMGTDNPEVGSFFQFGAANQMDGSVPFSQVYPKLYFTRVFQGSTAYRGQAAETWLSIANPTTESVTVHLKLYRDGSTSATTANRSIPANGFFYETVGSIFGQSSVSSGYVTAEVSGGGGIVGFELVKLTSKQTVVGVGGQPAGTASKLYSAQLASLSGFYTNVKLVNTSGQSVQATLRATDEAGNNLAGAVTRTIPAGGVLEEDASSLFGFGGSQVAVGSLTIEADRAGLVGDVVFGDGASFTTAAALPLQTETMTRGIFSQVANVSGLFTGVALFNPGEEPADVTVQVYSVIGTKTGEKVLTLQPGERISKLLTDGDFIPSTAGQVGGYVDVRSTEALIAQQLFGSATLLSAVPPTTSLTIAGPGGSAVVLPPSLKGKVSAVHLGSGDSTGLLEADETAVSEVIEISVGGRQITTSSDVIRLEIPVTKANPDPSSLRAKLMLTTGHSIPVAGSYDSESRSYSAFVFGLVDGWTMAIAEGAAPSVVETSSRASVRAMSETADWTTLDWEVVDHSRTLSAERLNALALLMKELSGYYRSIGFRAPRLWNKPVGANGGALFRNVLNVVNKGWDNFYSPCEPEKCNASDPSYQRGEGISEDELVMAGSIYLDWGLRDLGFVYLMAHELFHAVQQSYGIGGGELRLPDSSNKTWRSDAYIGDGTADVVGMTYQDRGTISTTSLSMTPYAHSLDVPLDDVADGRIVELPYSRQEFFGFLALRYFRSTGLVYLHEMLESIGNAVTVNTTLLQDMRTGLDSFLRAKGTSLPDAFAEYAFERSYRRSPQLALRPNEVVGPNQLATSRFTGSGVVQWNSAVAQDGSIDPITVRGVLPLSMRAVQLTVPAQWKSESTVEFSFQRGGADIGQPGQEGIRIYALRENSLGTMIPENGLFILDSYDSALGIPVKDVEQFTFLIINADLDESADVRILGKAYSKTKVTYSVPAGENSPGITFDLWIEAKDAVAWEIKDQFGNVTQSQWKVNDSTFSLRLKVGELTPPLAATGDFKWQEIVIKQHGVSNPIQLKESDVPNADMTIDNVPVPNSFAITFYAQINPTTYTQTPFSVEVYK